MFGRTDRVRPSSGVVALVDPVAIIIDVKRRKVMSIFSGLTDNYFSAAFGRFCTPWQGLQQVPVEANQPDAAISGEHRIASDMSRLS